MGRNVKRAAIASTFLTMLLAGAAPVQAVAPEAGATATVSARATTDIPRSSTNMSIAQSGEPLPADTANEPASDEEINTQAKVGAILDKVEAAFKDQISYTHGGRDPVVAFRDEVPSGAAQILAGSPRTIQVRTAASFTRSESVLNQEKLHDQLIAAIGPEAVTLSIEETGEVRVNVNSQPAVGVSAAASDSPGLGGDHLGASPERNLEIAQAIAAQYARQTGFKDIIVASGPASGGTTSAWTPTGGTKLVTPPGGGLHCTSGFVVESRAYSDLGVLTAGHSARSNGTGAQVSTLFHNGASPSLSLRNGFYNSSSEGAY